MNALDTNIWIYSHDSRDPTKQQVAKRLIGELRPMALLWQVGCEFIAASRKLAAFGFTEEEAWAGLADMQTMADAIILPDPVIWLEARRLKNGFELSFWDALLAAACVRGGVKTLYSEDFGALRQINGLSLINPFVSA